MCTRYALLLVNSWINTLHAILYICLIRKSLTYLTLPFLTVPFQVLKRVRQAKSVEDIKFMKTPAGSCVLLCGPHRYLRNAVYKDKVYWKCSKWRKQCRARVITNSATNEQTAETRYAISGVHNHT